MQATRGIGIEYSKLNTCLITYSHIKWFVLFRLQANSPFCVLDITFDKFLKKSILSTTSRLAQLVEHETLNLRVVGSSPTLGDHLFKKFSHPVKRKPNTCGI